MIVLSSCSLSAGLERQKQGEMSSQSPVCITSKHHTTYVMYEHSTYKRLTTQVLWVFTNEVPPAWATCTGIHVANCHGAGVWGSVLDGLTLLSTCPPASAASSYQRILLSFSVAMIKYPGKSNWREEGWFVSQLQVALCHCGEVKS